MKFSKRILKIKPSPTLEITARANNLKAKGVDVINFGAGEPDFDTPSPIKDAAIKAINNGKTKYTPAGGIIELKKAILQKFKRDNNLNYDVNEVTVNCGGKHSIYNLMQILLNDGDEVIVPAPYWVSYPPVILLAGGTPIILETNEENSFKISPEKLKSIITSKTRAIIINSPSNPTGVTYSQEELQNISDILKKQDIIIISDDIYESLIYDSKKFINMANLSEEIKKKTIVLNGVSKTYSMTGWRIGYMAGDEAIIKKVEILQSQSTSNPCSISQWAALEALTIDQSLISDMVNLFNERRTILTNKLNQIPGVSCLVPNGSFYTFPNVKEIYKFRGWKSIEKKYSNENNSVILSSYLLDESRIAVIPGIAFGCDLNIRLSFAASKENIIEGIERIKKAIEKLV